MKIRGNTILITGGTSGIGRALAEALYSRGNKVIITGRRKHLLDEISKSHAGMVGLEMDAEAPQSVDRLASEVKTRFPELNVLINNAGISQREDYKQADVPIDVALATIQTNVTSVIQLTAALLPLLRSQPHATLMATTSGLAFVPFPPSPTYSASKAFLHNWLVALRFQLRNTSVEVLELAPPYVQTELGGAQQATDPRAMPLQAFTREVIQILEDGRTENGEILVENVKPLRWAEKTGNYAKLLAAFGEF